MRPYVYLQLAADANPAVIFRGIVGSHAYGTANAQSDVDMRGIFTVQSREYVRLASPPKQVSDERNDRTRDTGGVFRGGAPVVSSIPKEDAAKGK